MTTDPGITAVRKVFQRLIPFSMLLLFFNLIDRTNIGFAALQMNQHPWLTPEVYGFAAGVFFLGYCLFEIPSNLILVRVGARRWLARIMISWGLAVLAMAWVSTPGVLYATRFLLGAAEAGLLPGLIFYLAYWVPAQHWGRAYALLMTTAALSNFFGGPIATGLMALDGMAGLQGVQIMFIVESAATVLVGFAVFYFLPDVPQDARWLTPAEQRYLADAHAADCAMKESRGAMTLRHGLSDRRVLLVTAVNFFLICCNFGTVYWLPQIVASLGNLTTLEVGFLTSIPYALGGLAMLIAGHNSDRTADRKWHFVAGSLLAVAGYAWAAIAATPIGIFMGLCLAVLGVWSTFGVFWAYAGDLLGGRAAAGGFAFMNSISALGGLVGPAMIGLIRARTQDFDASLLALAALAAAAGLLAMSLGNVQRGQLREDKAVVHWQDLPGER